MFTTALEILGVALLVAFAAVVWPPLALAVAGVACLVASWSMSRGNERDAS